MAADPPWSVRAAQTIVNGVDRAVGIFMGSFAALDKRDLDAPGEPPLVAFRRVAAVGAKGAKWSFIAVIAVAVCAMLGALIIVPRLKPALTRPPVADAHAMPASDRAVIVRNCREGRYRSFPEIEKTECAARPASSPARHQGDAK